MGQRGGWGKGRVLMAPSMSWRNSAACPWCTKAASSFGLVTGAVFNAERFLINRILELIKTLSHLILIFLYADPTTGAHPSCSTPVISCVLAPVGDPDGETGLLPPRKGADPWIPPASGSSFGCFPVPSPRSVWVKFGAI